MTWTSGPLKHWLVLNDAGTWGTDPVGTQAVPVIRSTEITLSGDWQLQDVALRDLSAADRAAKRLRVGDLVVVKSSGSPEHLGKTAVVTEEVEAMGACFANFVQRLRLSRGADPRYVWYLLNSQNASAEMGVRGSTTTGLRNLNGSDIASVTFPGPPFSAQRAIADFLDNETARIDALIKKKRQLMDLLRERYRAQADLVTSADRFVPLRRVADLVPGYMFARDDFGAHFDGARLLRGVNVGVGVVRWNDEVRLRPGHIVAERYRLREGDIVIGMDRPFIGSGTRVALVDRSSAGALLVQRVCRVRTSSSDAALVISSLLASRRFVAHVEPDLTGVSVPHLSDSQIGAFPIPALRDDELAGVATRLTQESHRMTELTSRLVQQISLLQERRQALITAAVTGELDIPRAAA